MQIYWKEGMSGWFVVSIYCGLQDDDVYLKNFDDAADHDEI